MRNKITSILLAFFIALQIGNAGEGMWLPLLLKSLNEAEMQAAGMKMTAEDIYNVNQGSLKDAIVHFGGFCTSEIISPDGLLLTNHHCGYGEIQSHSSVEHNYLKDGFWAMNRSEELSNPGLTATFIESMADVSVLALAGVTDSMNESERQSVIDKNLSNLRKGIKLSEHQDLVIKAFFNGNQYFSFTTITYKDIRLVGAPPESIGKFGADTDNWVFPRHTGDFSLFRIYADENNQPAEYSPTNVPFKPKHFLPISLDGVEEGDFTLVFGFPGRTNQYLPSPAVSQIIETLNPAKIGIREKALSIVDAAMRADESVRIKYASKFASIANYWKKWIGESQGLQSTNALGKKYKLEKEFTERVQKNKKWEQKYGSLLSDFDQLYTDIEPYAFARDFYSEVASRNVEIFRMANALNRLVGSFEKNGEAGFNGFKPRIERYAHNFYKNYESSIDQDVFAALLEMYVEQLDNQYIPKQIMEQTEGYEEIANAYFTNSSLTNADSMKKLMNQNPESIVKTLSNDPIVQLSKEWNKMYGSEIAAKYNSIKTEIDQKQRLYMQALMEVFPERRFFPDANSTMRVTYGNVAGYEPRDAVSYKPVSYLDGVMEKYKPGDYEFDVSDKLKSLYESKDYGSYADKNGKMPVCFIGTNHTTGGNSGSPVIDAHGNLIGLNFDRVWEGTMSDINYDPSICRNIMVDARYILFIIDKYAGASHLIEEMKLVRPKS